MFRRAPLLLLLAVAINSTNGSIDFTPTVKEYTREGMIYRQVSFKDEKGTITFMPPPGWTLRGAKDRLQLSPPGTKFAEASIEGQPPTAAKAFDEPTLKALEQQVLAEAPSGSQSVKLLKREENPILLEQNLSFEFVITYQALGQNFQRSVIFVRMPTTQLIFRLSAPKAEFEALNQTFRRSITSWHWLEPAPAANGSAGASAGPVQPKATPAP